MNKEQDKENIEEIKKVIVENSECIPSEMSELVDTLIASIRAELEKETKKKTLKELLLEFESNQLEGKGYDFYFVIRTKLDELLK